MGIFGKKQQQVIEVVPLKRGTSIALVDVAPAFVEQARSNYPREPRVGHRVPVALMSDGRDIYVYADGQKVGRIDPNIAHLYLNEFGLLEARGQAGGTDALIKWEGSKSPHSVDLNWGVNAVDGGIL